jgi:hypothetical protein
VPSDAVAVARTERECAQDQHLERAGEEVGHVTQSVSLHLDSLSIRFRWRTRQRASP